jgi:hypothetical protein
MGGEGSGTRPGEPRPRRKTTEFQTLDIRALKRQGQITPGQQELFVMGDEIALGEEQLGVVWTPCGFGGFRPWFVCPGPEGLGCNRRAAILYLDTRQSGRLLCRLCLDLAYPSQSLRAGAS